jgi:hypothetical protein
MGVETLDNMIVKPQGAVIRRPGTKYIGQTKNNTRVRLIPFEYSTTDTYILEFGNLYIRFYRNGGQIQSGGSAYEITTVYTTAQLRDIQYVQLNDVMYLVHPDVAPQKLSRLDHDSWTIADVDFTWGPFLDENTTTTTITPSGTTGSITLTASASTFTNDHVGALWEIRSISDNTSLNNSFTADGNSDQVPIEGDGLMTLEGSWSGVVTLEKSDDSGTTWLEVYSKNGGDAANIEYAFSEDETGFKYRLTMESYTSGECEYTLVDQDDPYIAGYVEITSVSGGTSAGATVVSELASTTATTKWSEGAFCDDNGWPRSVCLYQNRLCFGGNSYMPNGFWASSSGDFENMRVTSLDTSAIIYEVGNAKQNPILWMQDKQGVIAGTSGSLIRIFSQSNESTLTATSIGSERQSENGSCTIQAMMAEESILFIDRNRKIVRDLVYDLQSDGFVAPSLSVMAEHITDPCVIEAALQKRPDTIAWYVLQDGNAVTLTYNREHGVVAWAKHTTDGSFESVAVIPSGNEDEIWFSVNRTIAGAEKHFIEQMQPIDWGSDPNDMWFVDSGLSYAGSSATTLTGLGHLEHETVTVFGDDGSYQTAYVRSGQITLDYAVESAAVGLPYTSQVITFPIEVQSQAGYTIGTKKKLSELILCLYETVSGEYGYYGQSMYNLRFPAILDAGDTYSGIVSLFDSSGWEDEISVHLRQTHPYPFGLTGILPKMEIED